MELTLDQLTKRFGRQAAVDGVTVRLTHGVYGLLGANGAGKTTLMRMVCGILNPTVGEIRLDGRSIAELGEAYRNKLGYLPQRFGYYPDFTAEEFLRYVAALKGLPPSFAKRRSRTLLEQVALAEAARKKVRTFSGGMLQRLGIAQALLNDPHLLVLDEPTAGLDPKERVRFRNMIADLAKDKIVLLSTHIVSDVEAVADCILLMKKGRILMSGTAHELTRSLEGAVWSCTADPAEAGALSERHIVSQFRHDEGRIELRLIAGGSPAANAVSVAPTLEDVYLYHFQEEATEDADGPKPKEANAR